MSAIEAIKQRVHAWSGLRPEPNRNRDLLANAITEGVEWAMWRLDIKATDLPSDFHDIVSAAIGEAIERMAKEKTAKEKAA